MDSGFQQDKAGALNAKSLFIPKVLLSILVAIAALIAGYFFVPSSLSSRRSVFPIVAVFAMIFALLGVSLIVVATRIRAGRTLKALLVLTGSSAAGVLLCAILHNVVYGLLIHCFGKGVWGRLGLSDEPVFFLLALVVCPILFTLGSLGSFVLLLKNCPPRPLANSPG